MNNCCNLKEYEYKFNISPEIYHSCNNCADDFSDPIECAIVQYCLHCKKQLQYLELVYESDGDVFHSIDELFKE